MNVSSVTQKKVKIDTYNLKRTKKETQNTKRSQGASIYVLQSFILPLNKWLVTVLYILLAGELCTYNTIH